METGFDREKRGGRTEVSTRHILSSINQSMSFFYNCIQNLNNRQGVYTPRVEETTRYNNHHPRYMSKRAMSIDNLSFSIREDDMRFNKENNHNGNYNSHNNSHDQLNNIGIDDRDNGRNEMRPPQTSDQNNNNEDNDEQIIPWRAHLRKTNSRLNLIG